MLRYLVFTFNEYYPSGGMADCVLKSSDYEEALKKAVEIESEPNVLEQMDYVEIYDVVKGRIVYESERQEPTPEINNKHWGIDYAPSPTTESRDDIAKNWKDSMNKIHSAWFDRGKY